MHSAVYQKETSVIIADGKGKSNTMNMKLISLTLDNFKGHKHLELRLEGRSADIFGDNGTGKSSVYDALTWLLFGKDSRGSGAFAIKPLTEQGQVADHAAVTSVEGVFNVDGADRELRRTYSEVWSSRRGSENKSFDGHASEYFVDGVPCKKGEYERRVGEMVREDIFRLLTSVGYFAGEMPWQERRSVLFNLAGVAGDRAVMAGKEEFIPLAAAMGELSLDDYRKKLLCRRKQLNGARSDIPARLDECQKTVEELSEVDFDALEAERTRAKERYDQARSALEEARQDGGRRELAQALRQADADLKELENQNTAFRLEQRAAQGPDELGPARRKLGEARSAADRARRELSRLHDTKQFTQEQIDRRRAEWDAANAERFQGSVCPTCGQTLPEEQLAAARGAFEYDRERRKKEAVARANDLKEALAATVKEIEEREAWLRECTEDASHWQAQVTRLEQQPKAEIRDMPEYQARQDDILKRRNELRDELRRLDADQDERLARLRRDVEAASAELSRLDRELAKQSTLAYAEHRCSELREQAAAAQRELDGVDLMLHICEQFLRYKAGFIEDSVNRKFALVHFTLFREQVNGGLEDCCEVTVDGVPYNAGLNDGAMVNAGMDIINTFSRHYDTYVPLFVDNAERVTRLELSDTQVIRLVVSEYDKELRCVLK